MVNPLKKTIHYLARKSGILDLLEEIAIGALGSGGMSQSGESVTPGSALGIAAVYACVGLLSETVAQLPLRVLRKRSDGGADEVRDHPLWRLLVSRPNEWQTTFEFREMAMQCLCLYGNFYAWKVRDSQGVVRELLPILPFNVSVEQKDNWSLEYKVTEKGKARTVSRDDLLHLRYRTLDGIRGISPIGYNRETLGLAQATVRHGSALFRNGAQPGGVLVHPGRLKREAAEALRKSWQEAHGQGNAGGIAVLEEGMKYEAISMSNEDAQYIETRQFTVEEIARIFRVPLHEIQSTQKTTSWGSGIEAMNIGFVTRTILPWVRRWETAIARDLVGDEPDIQVKFNMEGLLRGDVKSRFEAYQIAICNGFMSPNEVRNKEDLNPRDGGDNYLTPLNMREEGEEASEEEGLEAGN